MDHAALAVKVDDHAKQLADLQAARNEHSRRLDEHAEDLDRHERTLTEVAAHIASLKTSIENTASKLDVQEMKTEILNVMHRGFQENMKEALASIPVKALAWLTLGLIIVGLLPYIVHHA